jgi:DNA-binding NtrC family response regulator
MDHRCEILVVDDEPIVGERLQATLERDGHRVTVFADPVAALAELEERTFDIVISDIRMGEVDGIQILEAVQRRSPGTRVIMITGYATIELARESLTKGAFDFIAKPFKFGEIRKTISKAIGNLEVGGHAGAGTDQT